MNHPPPNVPPVPPAVHAAASAVPTSGLDLDSAMVPDVVRALCLATGHVRFAVSPDVVAMGQRLTLQLVGSEADVWRDGLASLDLAGVSARCVDGLCRFFVPPAPEKPKEVVPQAVFSYEPKFRDVEFLASSLSGVFQGWHFAGGQSAASSGQAVSAAVSASSGSGGGGSGPSAGTAHQIESVPVRLVGLGPAADRVHVMDMLQQLDRPVSSLVVRLAVYEVDVSDSQQSAINVVGKILSSTVSIGASVPSSAASAGAAGISISTGGFSLVASALDSSSVAHLVTSPVLRTSSGVMASFAVGDSVPTVGSVSYAQGSSTPVQSIEYQQSGVVFSVVPQLVGGTVDVALYQSISSFTSTAIGVTSSPTLQNRVLSSDLVVRPGAVVVLGGLMQTNDTKASSGWWVLPNLSKDNSKSKTELVLVLSVDVDPR